MEDNDIESLVPPVGNKIDPMEFDVTVSALLIGIGAEKYLDIFRRKNIGQCTLMELTDEDLVKLGVDDAQIRTKLMQEVKNLPVYEEYALQSSTRQINNLDAMEIVDILQESSQHLYRIYLSMLANTLAVKKTNKISDCLVHRDKYASDIAIATLSEITNILNSMDIAVHTKMKAFTKEPHKSNGKKLFIGTMGSCMIAVLTVLFVRSLKQLK